MEQRVLIIQRINPHCGCSDKAFYSLWSGDSILGSDEFPYKNDEEFNRKVEELRTRFNATLKIEP